MPNGMSMKEYMREYRKKYKSTAAYKEARKNYKSSIIGQIAYRKEVLNRKYGISLLEFDRLNNLQKGKCAICGTTDPTRGTKRNIKYLCVDHDNINGKVRGLLCYKCNLALGYFDHNITALELAIHYLKKNA